MHVRRILAIILAIWLLVALAATFLLWRINSTMLSPDYVKAAVSGVGNYDFLYDQALKVLIDDGINNSQDLIGDDLQFSADEDTPAFLGLINDVIPRDEFQARVELTIDQILPWATGDTDTVEISLRLNELVENVPGALELRMAQLGFGDRVVDNILAPNVEQTLNFVLNYLYGVNAGTLDLEVSEERARAIAREIAPGIWLEVQIVSAARELTGWMTRDTDSFEVRVHYAERIPHATKVIKDVLDDFNIEDYLFNTIISPEVTQSVGMQEFLIGQVIITPEEVNEAIELVAPREWIREQRNSILDSMSRYLSGQDDELLYAVDMRERREATVDVIADLGEEKLLKFVNVLPACVSTEDAVQAIQQALTGVIPDCYGQDEERALLEQAVTELIGSLRNEIDEQIGTLLPETIVVDEPFLEATAGPEIVAQLRELRRLTRDGFVFTDEDLLREMTSPGSGITVEDIELLRDVLSEDYTINERDLLDRIGPAIGNEDLFETSRKNFGQLRSLWWLIFYLPGLLLVAIFFLGGRTWSGRIAWAAGTLGAVSIILWIAVWLGFQVYGLDEVQRSFDRELVNVELKFRPIVDDAYGRAIRIVDLWGGDYSDTARNTFIGSLLVFGLAILWHYSVEGSRVRNVGDTLSSSATTFIGQIRPPRPPGDTTTGQETGAVTDRDADVTRAPLATTQLGGPAAQTQVGGRAADQTEETPEEPPTEEPPKEERSERP